MKNKMKYEIDFCCAPTGSCWSYQARTTDQVEHILRDNFHISNSVSVWDNEFNDFIYMRGCFSYAPHIDLIHNRNRDLRTTTRTAK